MKTVWTDRSRILEYQRCNHRRWLAYHEGGMGLAPRRTPLPLAVGSAVHAGLAVLLREGQRYSDGDKYAYSDTLHDIVSQRGIEELAVKAALAELATHADGLELDLSERAAQGPVNDIEGLKASLGQTDDTLDDRIQDAKGRFDQYLFQEQSALCEGMVRAYARRRLRPLLEQYEVLEVEREGDWLLTTIPDLDFSNHYAGDGCVDGNHDWNKTEIRFASRPDALLRDRESNQLYIQSFKTAASWDIRKERDAERDMQGLSEGVEIERRLGALWHAMHDEPKPQTMHGALERAADRGQALGKVETSVGNYLRGLDSPPRILGIRMEYLFKNKRDKDKDLTQRMGMTVYAQKSPLIRGYLNPGMTDADAQWCWTRYFHKEDGSTSQLYWKTWHGTPVWEHMSIKKWIDMLDQTVEAVGEEGRALGWQGPAQTAGFTDGHPLDEVFHPPLVVYRNDDQLRDWFEQTEAQERHVAESVEQVRAASDDERRSRLNVLFPMYRQSCEYPTTCPFVPICYGPEHVQRDPMSTGRYKVREANHPQEVEHASQS
jgi:hypothetical protein